jgi:U3 small nucleolar RNA-associated protein 14
MDKWIGIVKLNREKPSLNFEHKDANSCNVNFLAIEPNNEFHRKIENKLQSMNIQSQKMVLKHEDAILEKVDPEEAKRRLK